ncbi:cytochrome P450 4g1-like [Macrosteles quadrilineatus]|uniref:cytochrome P450 4g1-like n=1 Tax=Macrosteles quadrilineatus TaxID=74068 RepID=UPI0023E218B7|nr:cytochrome P450 4g1-like [Macrosteles quadrilineatus]XP_054287437.1 cytochrome P450 4g1-like [Macrosteles quadrilineatus]XP_054287438.1 cytochrome P450 4g1-like [Macrosteles quadrilineatus]XP_054287439.1 cytochrome P450 4g1-like [Macrosteles quadrilineatus]XP_054287440.1 cytochrome P450 4g1-like [Macrosteles quadrilineatus]XP_054287441.1 cytochrome P450 4g1-like [Macrosteles quadrilineatus]
MLAALLNVLTTLLIYSSLLLGACWVWFQWSHRDLLRAAKKIPVSYPTIPILGHAYISLFSPEEKSRRILNLTVGAMIKQGWKTICFWVGPLPLIVVGDMNDLQTLFNGQNTADKPEEYDYFVGGLESGAGPFGQHILSARGQTWKLTRKHLNPMFHPQNVQHMISVFNMNSRELVERMNEHVGLKSFDVMHYTMDLALKTICNLIYGPLVPIDIHSKPFKGLMKIVEDVPELFMKRLLRPWLRIEWIFQLLYKNERNEIQNSWKNFTEPLLKMARKQKLQKTKKDNEYVNTLSNESEELLDMLDAYPVLQQKHPEFAEAHMLGEMFALYCTGTDTVGSTTAACMLALAQYPDVQDRLYSEIISVVGLNDDITPEDLSRMPYLEQVIKETMRKFLIVPFVLRKMSKDVELSSCTLPAGSVIACNLANIHMDPEVYPNPDEFDPERFSIENSSDRKEKFSFIPFSGGPRMCIAKNYAMNLMKIQIAHVLRNFRLSTSQSIDKMKRKLIVTLVSTEGYNIRVEKRVENRTGFHSD